MNAARWLLVAAALLLAATAAFHSTGLGMISGWLPGQRGAILQLLWISPAIDWLTVSVLWLLAAWRGRQWIPVIAISAIIPSYTAIGLLLTVGASHPGLYMLAGSVVLALLGAGRLR